ncbi:hypothetical protein ABG775_11550 [Peribacillus simplex]|uniref:hypothetical protein n=1 Tax=Peribacillus TaxID=2675229 RepID=UPI00177FABCF|nr:hypothetical protein [Brevibacillus sp. JNUCC-41]QOS89016.1 hypothetical protein JNUCC41_19850 [Brevibacillus sp. JNUCC-41]
MAVKAIRLDNTIAYSEAVTLIPNSIIEATGDIKTTPNMTRFLISRCVLTLVYIQMIMDLIVDPFLVTLK